MITQAISTRGHHVQRRERAATGPGRPCIMLKAVTPTGIEFWVTPPTDIDYAGTKIQYNVPGSCSGYAESGPEVSGVVTITGLVQGRIYAFIPWAYDSSSNKGKPGNVYLASWPINVIDMAGLAIDSCSLELIWQLINRKADQPALAQAFANLDQQVIDLTAERNNLRTRATRLEAELLALRRKISGS